MKKVLKNNILVKVEGEVLIIDKRGAFFSNSRMFIKIQDITGIIEWDEIIIVLGNGINTHYELNDKNRENIKRMPNSIIGRKEEIDEIYKELYILVQNIPNM